MDFIDTAYSFFTPFLLIGCLLLKNNYKKYAVNVMAVVNISLIFYSVFIARQLYSLYFFTKDFNLANRSFQVNMGWFELRLGLLMLLPFIFLFKKLSAGFFLTAIILVLLWWNKVQELFINRTFSVNPFYTQVDWLFKILNYICLLVAGYALLWLLKRLPHQQAKN